jgi:hypothetical protein
MYSLPNSITVVKMKEGEMGGGPSSTCRGEIKCIQGFGEKT